MQKTYKEILVLIFMLIVIDILMICGFAYYRFSRNEIINNSIKNAPLRSNLSASYNSVININDAKSIVESSERILISNNDYNNVIIKEMNPESIDEFFNIIKKADMKEKSTIDYSDFTFSIKTYVDNKEVFTAYYIKDDSAVYLKYRNTEYVLYFNDDISNDMMPLLNK